MDLHFRAAVALAPVSWSPRDPRRTRFENFFYNISVIEEEVIGKTPRDDNENLGLIAELPFRQQQVLGCDTHLLRLPCGHSFGNRCMSRWVAGAATCPMCRHALFDMPRPSIRVLQRILELLHRSFRLAITPARTFLKIPLDRNRSIKIDALLMAPEALASIDEMWGRLQRPPVIIDLQQRFWFVGRGLESYSIAQEEGTSIGWTAVRPWNHLIARTSFLTTVERITVHTLQTLDGKTITLDQLYWSFVTHFARGVVVGTATEDRFLRNFVHAFCARMLASLDAGLLRLALEVRDEMQGSSDELFDAIEDFVASEFGFTRP
ncbi:hypothetical protein SLS56_001676 [Neofusicoccum ribis]|uniref:RING-type domain-containing protein n=1 Tax=Neofusicoccum ribis TaxID=45134 RepID=A0ABR3T7U6_9PEZI